MAPEQGTEPGYQKSFILGQVQGFPPKKSRRLQGFYEHYLESG